MLCKLKENEWNKLEKMTNHPISGPILSRLAQVSKLSSYSISRKAHHPNPRKWQQTSFWAWFRLFGPKFRLQIWLRQSLDIIISDYHVQYQKKTNDPIARKFCEGRTDGRTDGHGREWFQRKLSDWSWAPNILRELNLIFSWVRI